MQQPRHIIITGASRGLGRALALHFAAPDIVLGLIGRNEALLQQVATICRQRGAHCCVGAVDVVSATELTTWIEHFDEQFPVDLLLTCAGVNLFATDGELLEPLAAAKNLLNINLIGVLHAVYAIVPAMRQRKSGQIALVSSLAGYRGMALDPMYCTSKAAIKTYGEALRDRLQPAGIKVSVILPGFIKSDMSDSYPGPKPFLLPADQAASFIAKRLQRDQAEIAFPWPLALVMKFLQAIPMRCASFLIRLAGFNHKH